MHIVQMHRSSWRTTLTRAAGLAMAVTLVGCAGNKPNTAPSTDRRQDARVGLGAGLMDAEEVTQYMNVIAKVVSPPGFLGVTNSDLAFTGNYVIQGNYNGPVIWDISDPSNPSLVTAFECPASQNDISVYRNLMFMSAEANNGHVDCLPGGVPGQVSTERMRGVRVFDITDIKNPKLIANVQTCRGSHTHTVLEDPKDKDNVYIYVSGSSRLRSAEELAGCADVESSDPNSSRLRIEIIRVPLADPSKSAVVGQANIFAGLKETSSHGASPADMAAAKMAADRVRAEGGFVARNPQSGLDLAVSPRMTAPLLDSIVKSRGGSGAPTSADSTALRGALQGILNQLYAVAPSGGDGAVSENSQCHDITVYPALGLAGGACEGHGLLLDISNPIAPVRLDAAADSNFAYWHSATFNNDGTKLLFSDEWGGGGQPKCREGDKPEWGANAIFSIENRKLKFESYYKIPTVQSDTENCVAHNGSLIPIPGRDVMVQSWYQGGISVFDWTDAANPKEIAYFDRGPIDAERMVSGGSWSVYWYNGQMISSEIARGMDVAELVPSPYITQNEIDAAKTVKWEYLNAQGQPKIEWPATFALARAFTDQLDRKECFADSRVSAIRKSLDDAEKATPAARGAMLTTLVTQLEADARGSCDPDKVNKLKESVQRLRAIVM